MHNLFPLLHAAKSSIDPGNFLTQVRPEYVRGALAQALPYLYCGEFGGFEPLHLLADDTLGFAFNLEVPVVDTVPEGEQFAADTIASMLQALEPGIQWQWFLRASANVEAALALYETQSGHDKAGRLFCRNFVQRWRDAQQDGFFPGGNGENLHPRTQCITVALKSPPIGLGKLHVHDISGQMLAHRWAAPLASVLGAGSRRTRAQSRARSFAENCRSVLAAAQARGWQPQPLDAAGLVAWILQTLFPQRLQAQHMADAPGGIGADSSLGINEIRCAIAALGEIDQIRGDGFRSLCGAMQRHHRVVSMLWQPRAVAPGMINALAGLRPTLQICVSAQTQSTATAMLQLKARALLNARSTHRFNETEMQARSEALQEVERRLFADGERILDLRLQVLIAEASAELAEEAALSACKHLESLEMEATVERDIAPTLLLRGCLPFAIYPRTEQKLRRRRRMLSRDCADLHPGGGAWTGIKPPGAGLQAQFPSPIVMYSNPLGEPLFIDPTKAEKNPHALVIGQSGSGKSFFVHDYLLHLWRLPDVRLFLISIKADYRKLALLLGRYVEVSLDCAISLNPFTGAPTLENQARWLAALALMLSDGEDSKTLSREAQIVLQQSAMTAAQRNWDHERQQPFQETLLEHICKELEHGAGLLGRQLAARLHPYRRGPFRQLFNAPRGIQASDRFVFFNLGGILRQPCAALASFCVFGLVDETMTDPSLRAVPKGLVADEVWALVRNSHAAGILERSLKAYRSLGGFALPIVQDPQDLDTPSGRVMLVNTATKIILPMDRSGQSDLQRYVRLNAREMEIVRDLRLVKRRYSEFFVSIDGQRSAKGLLIPDPLRYAVSTTDPVDEHIIEQRYRQCGDMLEALRQFAAESPYGLQSSGRTAPPDLAPRGTSASQANQEAQSPCH